MTLQEFELFKNKMEWQQNCKVVATTVRVFDLISGKYLHQFTISISLTSKIYHWILTKTTRVAAIIKI